MAKDLKITMLLDAYGQLLTDKQRAAIDMYYNDDLSLAEIADEIGISRQGVLASIKQGEKHLTELEDTLGVVRRFRLINSTLTKINDIIDNADFENKEQARKLLAEIEKEI